MNQNEDKNSVPIDTQAHPPDTSIPAETETAVKHKVTAKANPDCEPPEPEPKKERLRRFYIKDG